MRIIRTIPLVVLCVAAAFPSGAAQTSATADYMQSAGVNINEYVVNGNQLISARYANVGITNVIGAVATNGSPTPSTSFLAAGSGGTCTYVPFFNCTYWYTNGVQVVSPTALSMDPAGNSATLVVTLNDQNNQPHTFNVRVTKPQSLTILRPDLVYNPQLNVYVDPDTSVIGASAYTTPLLGIARGGYAVSGIVDGAPYVPASPNCAPYCNSGGGNSYQSLNTGVSAVVP